MLCDARTSEPQCLWWRFNVVQHTVYGFAHFGKVLGAFFPKHSNILVLPSLANSQSLLRGQRQKATMIGSLRFVAYPLRADLCI